MNYFSCTYSEERKNEFRRILKKDRGFDIFEVESDGACLFRSVSDQVSFSIISFFLERTLIEHIDVNYNVALILSFILSIHVLLQMFFVLDLGPFFYH